MAGKSASSWRPKIWLRVIVALAALVAPALVVGASNALAAESVALSPTTGAAGTSFDVIESGFLPPPLDTNAFVPGCNNNSDIGPDTLDIIWDPSGSNLTLGQFPIPDAATETLGPLTVPAVSPGVYTVEAECAVRDEEPETATATFTVPKPVEPPPSTTTTTTTVPARVTTTTSSTTLPVRPATPLAPPTPPTTPMGPPPTPGPVHTVPVPPTMASTTTSTTAPLQPATTTPTPPTPRSQPMPKPKPGPVQPAAVPLEPGPGPGNLQLAHVTVSPGQQVSATGYGCVANSPVLLTIDGQPVGHATADPHGRFAARVEDGPLAVGPHRVVAHCGAVLAAPLSVVVASSVGTGSATVLIIILFFLLVGLAVFRRRLQRDRS